MATPKLLPVGIPTFHDVINGGYLYVDKTPLIYELIRNPKGIYFWARSRRFGKSILVSTFRKPLHLVGANFSTRKRGISAWKTEAV